MKDDDTDINDDELAKAYDDIAVSDDSKMFTRHNNIDNMYYNEFKHKIQLSKITESFKDPFSRLRWILDIYLSNTINESLDDRHRPDHSYSSGSAKQITFMSFSPSSEWF